MRAEAQYSAPPGADAALERLGDEKPALIRQADMNDKLESAMPVRAHRHAALPCGPCARTTARSPVAQARTAQNSRRVAPQA